ncbi:MAG: hypothetical protein QNJ70_31890 [Xenococcaceae cyanobacterium MO_207.B15]|nr:hypothetical protein [Xenococcaceae cyanobacterium MO_207.B15]MDJ0744061.1 hypothetical protein [Xenococcaceae cyanobacterium MO_167.B27]
MFGKPSREPRPEERSDLTSFEQLSEKFNIEPEQRLISDFPETNPASSFPEQEVAISETEETEAAVETKATVETKETEETEETEETVSNIEKISLIISPYFIVLTGLFLYKDNHQLIGTILIGVGILSLLRVSVKDVAAFFEWLKNALGFGDIESQ